MSKYTIKMDIVADFDENDLWAMTNYYDALNAKYEELLNIAKAENNQMMIDAFKLDIENNYIGIALMINNYTLKRWGKQYCKYTKPQA